MIAAHHVHVPLATFQAHSRLLREWLGEGRQLYIPPFTVRTNRFDEVTTNTMERIRGLDLKVCILHSLSTHLLTPYRSWPGTAPVQDEEDSYSNIFTPQPEIRYANHERRSQHSSSFSQASKRRTSNTPQLLRTPPQCRLPTSIRFTTLVLYVTLALLFVSTSAVPFSSKHALLHLQNRQSIPDQFGNTGNEPAPVASQPPPRPLTPTPSPTPSLTSLPTFSLTPSSAQPTATVTTGSNGNSNPPGDGAGINPGPPAEELQLTKPQLSMSPGALAGIIGGGVVVLAIIIGLSVYLYRRSRRPEVTEIPIRRSKLGSRLGRRIFGSPAPSRAASRSSSRRSTASLTGEMREKQVEGWLDKGIISRPRPHAWSENGLLSVPRPLFVREEREKAEEGERWVDKGTISAPRPARPASAEPLGRLSGMGSGMGYLK